MITYYVYLIKSQKRLVILKNKVDNNDYHEFMKTSNIDDDESERICKVFCIGFILGGSWYIELVNDINEFL